MYILYTGSSGMSSSSCLSGNYKYTHARIPHEISLFPKMNPYHRYHPSPIQLSFSWELWSYNVRARKKGSLRQPTESICSVKSLSLSNVLNEILMIICTDFIQLGDNPRVRKQPDTPDFFRAHEKPSGLPSPPN